jgi:hypothetical protein
MPWHVLNAGLGFSRRSRRGTSATAATQLWPSHGKWLQEKIGCAIGASTDTKLAMLSY